jgi:serine protease AprX
MPSSLAARTRPTARSWRAVAVVTLAVALVLPVGASSGASQPMATPMVRQLAWWADGNAAGLTSLTTRLRAAGASVVARLSIADAVVVEVPSTWQAPRGVATAADRPMSVAGNADDSQPGVRHGEQGPGNASDDSFDGDGVTVAVVDTGVADVADLAGSVEHVNVSGAPRGDGYGHGTFLAGLIASSGASSGGLYRGVAPKANILDVQVAAADGSTSLLRVLAGLQAVAERARRDDSLRVVNLSLSADDPGFSGIDPLSRAVESLWARGLVVLVAAGNDGPNDGTVSVPGTDPAVITVGALDDGGTRTRSDDVVAPFSARGNAAAPNVKPDLVAPGVSTIGLRAPGSIVDTEHPTARVGSANFRGSGTSMATAIASGTVAGLLSELPNLDPDDVKGALMRGAYEITGDRTATGAGGLDLRGATAAVEQMSQDRQQWSGRTVAAVYDRFATAWRNGSRSDATAAWLQLPLGLRAQVAAAWATSVAGSSDATDEQAVRARAWAQDGELGADWVARTWAARTWAARTWAADDWAARTWAARTWASDNWAARTWAARTWAADDWAARTWAARTWSGDDWAARTWAARTWAADDWAARTWAARTWSARTWAFAEWDTS